jgi:hypothetical protein
MVAQRCWKRIADRHLPLFDSPQRSTAAEVPPANRSATSRAAALSIAAYVPTLRQRVLSHLVARGAYGATAEETAIALAARIQSITARLVELDQLGQAIDSGRTRRTSSGRAAKVWVAVAKPSSDPTIRANRAIRRPSAICESSDCEESDSPGTSGPACSTRAGDGPAYGPLFSPGRINRAAPGPESNCSTQARRRPDISSPADTRVQAQGGQECSRSAT